MKLVLFDVDGTILSASGAGRRALQRALRDVYGTAGPIAQYDFRGGTDPQIIRDLLGAAGLDLVAIEAGEPRLFARYLDHLEAEVGAGEGVSLYPGVEDLIEALSGHAGCLVGLLTGNIERGARIKLRSTGLWPRFRVGAYGSDHSDRRRLPAVAASRAAVLVGRPFGGADTVIIGDTPRDIECARAFEAAVVAVATGTHSVPELRAHQPDHVFPDLADTARVMAAIFRDPPRPRLRPFRGGREQLR
jgi:phosphoglycolate phosphatase-like HAD superfamily hydrolase